MHRQTERKTYTSTVNRDKHVQAKTNMHRHTETNVYRQTEINMHREKNVYSTVQYFAFH